MKEKITEQSVLLFEKKGFSQTSIQDIADALNVTKGTFYYYFSSKEQLLMEIHFHYIADLLQRQRTIIADDTATYKEKLRRMIRLLIFDIRDKGASARVFFREMKHLSDANAEKIKQKRDAFRCNIEKLIRDGVSNGEFSKELQADMIAFGILGVTNWSYQWYDPNGKISEDALSTIFVNMILNGIVADSVHNSTVMN